jgi:hypothetical protein
LFCLLNHRQGDHGCSDQGRLSGKFQRRNEHAFSPETGFQIGANYWLASSWASGASP